MTDYLDLRSIKEFGLNNNRIARSKSASLGKWDIINNELNQFDAQSLIDLEDLED